MHTFLLLAIPCTLLYYLHSSLARERYWSAFFIGFFPSVIYCVIDEFFIFTTHRFTNSFAACYTYILLKEYLIPTLVLGSLYLLISKRPLEDRFFSLLIVLSAFYMVYMPFEVITSSERFSPYLNLIKPLNTCSSIIIISLSGIGLCRSLATDAKFLLGPFALCILIALFLPSFAESLWYMNTSSLFYRGISGFIVVLSIAISFFLHKIQEKTLDKSI